MDQKIFNWGIIGSGIIAHEFVEALSFVSNARLAGVVSKDLANAQEFAKTYQITNASDNVEIFLNDDRIDAIYIATPHNSHFELTLECLKSGKAVLCEKPIAVNSEQVNQMIATAKQHNTFLMEALWTRFLPHIKKLNELFESDDFGNICFIDSNFAFKTDYPPDHRYNNPALAGGSLLDIGIYPLFLCYLLLGRPEEVIADALMNKQGVDRTLQLILKFKNARANIFSSFSFNAGARAHIYSDSGMSIHILDKFNTPNNLILEDSEGNKELIEVPISGNGFNYEIEEVQKCLANKELQSKLWSWQDSLNLMIIMDSIRDKISLKYPFE